MAVEDANKESRIGRMFESYRKVIEELHEVTVRENVGVFSSDIE